MFFFSFSTRLGVMFIYQLFRKRASEPNHALDLMSALCPLMVLLVSVVAAIGHLKR
jgi:hypothetical protein